MGYQSMVVEFLVLQVEYPAGLSIFCRMSWVRVAASLMRSAGRPKWRKLAARDSMPSEFSSAGFAHDW